MVRASFFGGQRPFNQILMAPEKWTEDKVRNGVEGTVRNGAEVASLGDSLPPTKC